MNNSCNDRCVQLLTGCHGCWLANVDRSFCLPDAVLFVMTTGLCTGGWRSRLKHRATSRNVAGSIPDGVTGIFHWQSFRLQYGPGVDSASNRNEYQEYLLGGKGGRCVGLTNLPLHVLIVLKCVSLNLPEPSGPVQGWTGIALLFFKQVVGWRDFGVRGFGHC